MADFLRFAREAIDIARRAGEKKRAHAFKLTELKGESTLRGLRLQQAGLTHRAGMPKPWFDRRAEELSQRVTEAGLGERLGITQAGLKERRGMIET